MIQSYSVFNVTSVNSMLLTESNKLKNISYKKQRLPVIIKNIQLDLNENRNYFIRELAEDLGKVKIWDNISSQLKAIDPDAFRASQQIIEGIKREAGVAKACRKYDINFEEYRSFMLSFQGNINGENEAGLCPLTKAIGRSDLNIVRVLNELGADLDKIDGEGNTPLSKAIAEYDIPMVELLLSLGAGVNKTDASGKTPLTSAVWHNQIKVVELLIKSKADLNLNDDNKHTPLTFAAARGREEIIKILVKNGADVNFSNLYGYTPFAYAMIFANFKSLLPLLVSLGADEKFATELLKRKNLAHIWGIKGFSTLNDQKGVKRKFELEASFTKSSLALMTDYIEKFFKFEESSNASLPEAAKQDIYETFNHALSEPSNVARVDRIKSGKPCVIMGGWCGHDISIVIHNERLFICNRGAGKGKNAVVAYQLPSSLATNELIHNFKIKYKNANEFNFYLQKLNLTKLGEYNQKDQKVGNCSWASAKIAFGVLCRIYTSDLVGRELYKKFTAFARTYSLEEYLKTSSSVDQELVDKVNLKMKKKKQNSPQYFCSKKVRKRHSERKKEGKEVPISFKKIKLEDSQNQSRNGYPSIIESCTIC